MKTMNVEDAFRDWRALADKTRREPVKVVGAPANAMVVMSEADYERLKGQAWDRVVAAMDRIADEAKASGLTEEKLDALLAS